MKLYKIERRHRSGLMYGRIAVFSLRLLVSVDLLIWESALLLQFMRLLRDHKQRRHIIQGYNVIEDIFDTVGGKNEGRSGHSSLEKKVMSQQALLYVKNMAYHTGAAS